MRVSPRFLYAPDYPRPLKRVGGSQPSAVVQWNLLERTVPGGTSSLRHGAHAATCSLGSILQWWAQTSEKTPGSRPRKRAARQGLWQRYKISTKVVLAKACTKTGPPSHQCNGEKQIVAEPPVRKSYGASGRSAVHLRRGQQMQLVLDADVATRPVQFWAVSA